MSSIIHDTLISFQELSGDVEFSSHIHELMGLLRVDFYHNELERLDKE